MGTQKRQGKWLRYAASAAMMGILLTGAAGAQKHRRHHETGKYSAPEPGKPLCTLRILVTGFRSDKGLAGGVVFASPAGWPERTRNAVVHGGFPIVDKRATEVFHIPPGKYAVAAIADKNENHKLDKNLLGMPTEGFGFANNPNVMFSAPSFQAASVPVACPVTRIHIRLIYK
jgi:uncharacterized protein (DUF2141 family)